MSIRLTTFGGLKAFAGADELDWIQSQRLRAAILIYLAVERTAARTTLSRMFWPESDEERARQALRQNLYQLKQHLGDDWVEARSLDLRIRDDIEIDVVSFDAAVAHGNAEIAVRLYAGPFLDGVHLAEPNAWEDWVYAKRLSLARAFRSACRDWVQTCRSRGDLETAIEAAERWVAIDPQDDEGQHTLIETLADSGRRTDALRQFESYERVLAAEGLTPLDETIQLIERIRNEMEPGPAPVPGPGPLPPPPGPGPPPPPPRPSQWLRRAAIALAGVVGVVLFVLWPRPPIPPPAELSTVGILPLQQQLQLDQDQGWLAAALETRLEQALSVRPVFALRSTEVIAGYYPQVPIDSIARILRIDFFVRIALAAWEDGTVVTIQLLEGSSGTVLDSRQLRLAKAVSSLAAAEELAASVEQILRPELGRNFRLRQWRAETRDTQTYILRFQAQKRWWDGVAVAAVDSAAADLAFKEADSLLATAQDRSPDWPESSVARARLAERRALHAWTRLRDRLLARSRIDHGIEQVERVLREQPRHAAALAMRGRLRWKRNAWRPDGEAIDSALIDAAEDDLRTALTIEPGLAEAVAAYSEIQFQIRQSFDEALRLALRAYELDAYMDETSLIIQRIAAASFELNDDTTAANWCREGIRRYPTSVGHYACALDVMAWGTLPPRADTAWALFERMLQLGVEPHTQDQYNYAVAAVLARAKAPVDSIEPIMAAIRSRTDARQASRSHLHLEAAVRFRMGMHEEGSRLWNELERSGSHLVNQFRKRRLVRDFVATAALPGG